jgi:hypothetical protein
MDMFTRPQRTPPTFRKRAVEIINEYWIRPITEQNPNDTRLSKVYDAVQFILEDDESLHHATSFGYFGRNSTAHHSMILYAMRPNLQYMTRLEQLMQQIFVADHNTRAKMMLGLPIRASDKCETESECPPFSLYMDLMQSVFEKYRQPMESNGSHIDVNIILTSESADVHHERRKYQGHNNNTPTVFIGRAKDPDQRVPFKFIINEFDIVQNTGDPTKLNSEKYVNKEEILLFTIASLQMQMYSYYSMANCCSNHHLILVDLLMEGCGIHHHDDVAQCMQDHDNPKFHLCCAWTKTPRCLERNKSKPLIESVKLK